MLSHVRRFSSIVGALLALVAGPSLACAQTSTPSPVLWFQGARLSFDHAVPTGGDLAVSTHDAGLAKFLDRLGATLAYEPQSRYVVVTAQDRRTIVFAVGDRAYTAGGIALRAPFAVRTDGNDAVLPFFALARALYVEAVPNGGETVLQPRVGVLDVRTDGPRTIVTVRAAMPLVTTTNAETFDRIAVTFVGQGSSLAPTRRAPGTLLDQIDVSAGGTPRIPTTTMTIAGVPGTTHTVVPGDTPDTFTVVFEPRTDIAPGDATPPPLPATVVQNAQPSPVPTIVAPIVVGRATVTDVTIAPTADDALSVRLTLSSATSFEWHRLQDHRWYIDLTNTTLTGPGRDERPTVGSVASVRVRQTGTSDAPAVRVAFTLSADKQIAIEPDADGITIVATNVDASDGDRSAGSGTTGGVAVAAATPEATPATLPWKFGGGNGPPGSGARTIVIDPGHGGDDTGTVHNGLVEKNITFDIAQRLRTLLVAQGWTVRMTRESDIDPVSSDNLARMRADGKPNADDRAYLQTRCDTANLIGARLFISIHVNSAPFSGARGTTFYWYKPQDAAFAQALERTVIPLAGTQDDGTRHENFYVVRHTTMPAVLIETAFVTNPGDVELLRQPAFLQNMAQGIADGVRAFAGAPASSPSTQ
jgi:N-acetylmuramoyl-L-alanine amidase